MTQAGAATGSVLGPLTFGALADALGFTVAWTAAGVSMSLAAALVWYLQARLAEKSGPGLEAHPQLIRRSTT